MTVDPTFPLDAEEPAGLDEGRRLAMGTAAIQVSTVASILSFLVVATALGRQLTLSEFGVYGLTLSFAAYVVFLQGSIEAAAVKHIAEAPPGDEQDRAVTATAILYVGLGIAAGLVVAGVGILLIEVLNIPPHLQTQARIGLVCLGGLIPISWALRTFHDLLHGVQRFVSVAVADTIAYLAFVVLVLVLLEAGAPLWALIAAGGSPMLLSGIASGFIVARMRLGIRFRRHSMTRDYMRGYLGFSSWVFAAGMSDLVIYQLDRTVLGIFRSARTIGLYEAIVRPQSLVRAVQGSLTGTVLPASSRYVAERDDERLKQLALRGTRYIMAATVPLAVTIGVLAGPILEVWLGDRYVEAQYALSIFVAYWIVAPGTAVVASMMWALGRGKTLAAIAWATAVVNLALSLILTPLMGLNGVVLGTTIAYLVVMPFLLRAAFRVVPITPRELFGFSWMPSYILAAALALALGLSRLIIGDSDPVVLLACGGIGVLAYWAAFYAVFMDSDERAFVARLVKR